MAEPYGWRMTPDGLALIAAALSSNAPIGIATIVLGDGGGTTPPVTATGIVHEVWRGPVSALRRSPDNRLVVEIQTIVPVSAGPFVIREAAILASDGTVIALCRRQDLYKGGPSETHAIDVLAQIVVSEAAVVEMAVDTGTYATLRTVQVAVDEGITAHAASRNHPTGTETAQGMVRFATKAETVAGTQTTAAVTPAGVKAVVDALVDGAPDALNTLRELAQAVANDQSFASSMLAALAAKAPLASPAFTGTPTVPTAAAGTATSQAASTAFVGNALAAFSGFAKTTTGAKLEAFNMYGGDLNVINSTPGVVITECSPTCTNTPAGMAGTAGILIQFADGGGDDVRLQIVIDQTGTSLYQRSKWGGGIPGIWRPWSILWSSANDGSGSGLDADLIDGLHASEITGATKKYLVLDQYNGNIIRNSLGVSSIIDHAVGQYTVSFATPWPYTYYVPATCNVGNTGPADAPECVVIEDRPDYMLWTTLQIRMAHRPSGEDYYVDGRPDTIIFAGM
ncbi:phage tail protein [Insolitispirillum peregrinum]|uniref:Phage tail-collar fibre protein n=1 Tax=Insolitispirillum peregrinum TaxID=80876 RepID=A0A1N7LRE7_9PROT|nr:phage tail protein [Insolitispirillum peregrinum]SIS76408.1 Phage tail-collar fibre protein [Insolitispirillum peregrinum]